MNCTVTPSAVSVRTIQHRSSRLRAKRSIEWTTSVSPSIAVPLNADGVALIRKQLGKHQTYVFTFQGKPRRKVNTKSWYAALRRAGIENFRWHDLRHTWASWHVQQGTPLHALQEMGAWESAEMVRRYAHLSAEHLTPYADRLSGLNVVTKRDGTNTAQAA